MQEAMKMEILKLLDNGIIYPISDSQWVSPVHAVPKKASFTVVENEHRKLVQTRLPTKIRICIDYQKLNTATRKDHIPLPYIEQMLERLVGHEYYYFSGRVLRIQSDTHCCRGPGEDHVHLPIRNFYLPTHALWIVQRSRYIPTVNAQSFLRYGRTFFRNFHR